VSSEGLTAGLYYQFKYKAINIIGESSFSGISLIPIADKPSKPSIPTQVFNSSSTSRTSITM
jgi:hypothetical protein